jgi:hypothetical protein
MTRDSDSKLSQAERADIHKSVQEGIRDIELGDFEEFDEEGLRDYFKGVIEKGRKRLAIDLPPLN